MSSSTPATTAAPPQGRLVVPEAAHSSAQATPGFNMLMAGLTVLLAIVFVLNQWAGNHDLLTDADIPLWTLLLLGTVLLSGLVLVITMMRERAKGVPIKGALPVGYGLSLVGVAVVLFGGLLDIVWRQLLTSYPIGDDLLRPTSLVQAAGALLIGTGPLRAAWRTREDRVGRAPWRVTLPALVAATALLVMLGLLTQRINPLVDTNYVAKQADTPKPANEIYRMNADGTGQTRLLATPGSDFWGPAWSPDGKKIAFTMSSGSGPGVLYTANADGSNATKLAQDGRGSYLPAWSPDGRKIAFISQALNNGNFGEVAVINSDGTGEKQLTNNDGWNYGVSWSPDSSRIVFGSRRSGTWQIYTAAADGSDQVLLDTDGGGNAPAWSPDGTRIAFTSDRAGKDDIYVVNVTGAGSSAVQRLTTGDNPNDNPAWSPDGKKITFTSYRAGNSEIYVMNADGSGAADRTNNPALDSLVPDWSPDGSQILYTAAAHSSKPDRSETQSLGIAAVLVQSALLAGVLLFLARRWRLPVGALTLMIVVSSLAPLAMHDHYELLPAAIAAALVAELLYAFLLPRGEGTLAARPSQFRLFAGIVPGLLYGLYLLMVMATQGLAWTADIALGAVLVAGAAGVLISFLVLPLAGGSAATAAAEPNSNP